MSTGEWGNVDSEGNFEGAPICWSEKTCLDPTGVLGIVGRPREQATRQVIAKSGRSPLRPYRRWGLCVANLLFRDDLVISSNDPRVGECAKTFTRELEGAYVPFPSPQAHAYMVQAYSRDAQDPSKPLLPRAQNAPGDYPPPHPLDRIYKLAEQTLDVAHQVKLTLDIGQCILVSEVPEAAAACILVKVGEYTLQKFVVKAIKWIADQVGKLTQHEYDRLVDRVKKWKDKHDKNDDPPTPMGSQATKPGAAPMNAVPLPLDLPVPIAAAQGCNCDEGEESLYGDSVLEHTRGIDSSPGTRSLLQSPSSFRSGARRGVATRNYGQAGEVYRLRDHNLQVPQALRTTRF